MLLSILSIQSIVGSIYYLLLSLVDISLDSPLAGSIILAGTILKLASYGMLRILLTYLPDASNYFSPTNGSSYKFDICLFIYYFTKRYI